MDDVSLAEMMAPIAGGLSVGVDVRGSGSGSDLYLTVKDERGVARAAEREALAAGDPDIDPLAAGARSWAIVASKGGELLARHSKDLQVAAWVAEAWLRTDGFAGLADGLTLLAELVEGYWDEGLYPAADEDGVETRVAPLFGLFGREDAGTLVQPIKLLPLADGEDRVALWTIEVLRRQSARHDDPEVREELAARRMQRIVALDAAIAASSPAFVATSLDAIDRALGELDRLMAAVDQRAPFGRFGSQVTAPLTTIAEMLRGHSAAAPVETVVHDARANEASPVATVDATPQQRPLGREAALATLIEVAGYFDRAEPQSLIGQALRDLVRRARLPAEGLLAELIPDQDQRALFLLRAGIHSPRDGSGATSF